MNAAPRPMPPEARSVVLSALGAMQQEARSALAQRASERRFAGGVATATSPRREEARRRGERAFGLENVSRRGDVQWAGGSALGWSRDAKRRSATVSLAADDASEMSEQLQMSLLSRRCTCVEKFEDARLNSVGAPCLSVKVRCKPGFARFGWTCVCRYTWYCDDEIVGEDVDSVSYAWYPVCDSYKIEDVAATEYPDVRCYQQYPRGTPEWEACEAWCSSKVNPNYCAANCIRLDDAGTGCKLHAECVPCDEVP